MASSTASSEEDASEQEASVFRLPSVAPAAFTFRFQRPETLYSPEEASCSSSGATVSSPGDLASASPTASSNMVAASLNRTLATLAMASPMESSGEPNAWSETDSESGASSDDDTGDEAWLEDIPPIMDLVTSPQGQTPVVISGMLDAEGRALHLPVDAQHLWFRAVNTVAARVARHAGLYKVETSLEIFPKRALQCYLICTFEKEPETTCIPTAGVRLHGGNVWRVLAGHRQYQGATVRGAKCHGCCPAAAGCPQAGASNLLWRCNFGFSTLSKS